ncbi:MAG: efflux RND transporter periplasmic adaptor subunit [Gammaproteobacteria bacterium]|nr:MAG: efflux RND transporter periplasmic adaptor subunit [Gammaproteobacteria bacterium]
MALLLQAGGALADPPEPPPVVTVAEAEQRHFAPVLWVAGTVIPRLDARVAAEVAGRLVEVAEVGTRVRKGELLARLDDRDYRLLRQEAIAMVSQLQAQLRFASQEVSRLEKLARQNNAARNRLDEVLSERDRIAGELKAARVRLQLRQLQLEKSAIAAPFDGVVTERSRSPGEWVDSGDPVVRLVDPERLEVTASVPQSALGFLREGLRLTVADERGETRARVRALVPVGDERSRLYELRLLLEGTAWRAGHVVRVAVPLKAPELVLMVPRDALVLRQEGTWVYRIDHEGRAERVPVEPGAGEGDWIAVSGALEAGDRVVVTGNERLRPGQEVRVQEPVSP